MTEVIMPTYDPNNIFAKILRGELPCYKVYEDDKALAFLDIMPRAPGHALVLPKAPARNILDIAPDDLAHAMTVAQKIANGVLGRRHHHPAVQRRCRRTGGFPPACTRHSAQVRRDDEAARERERKAGSFGRAGQKARRGDYFLIVIARSEATKQSRAKSESWIASLRSQ
jgi:hypothetical protein